MSMSQIWTDLGPIGQIAIGVFTLFWTILAFYWSNLRPQARHIGIVDLATKRLAFWDAFLKLELSATSDPDEQEHARSRALRAVQRIRSHANRDLDRLSWLERTNTLVFKHHNPFSLHRPPPLAWPRKLEFLFQKLLCYYFLLIAVVTFLLTIHRLSRLVAGRRHPTDVAYLPLAAILIITFLLVARVYGMAAERLAFAGQPRPPILDEI